MKCSVNFGVVAAALFVVDATVASIDVVRSRQIQAIVDGITGVASIPAWLSALDEDGKWPDDDVNYTVGCDAQRGSWPAQQHWRRISTFAGAWHGGVRNAAQYERNATIRDAISRSMDYWFRNDYTNPECLDKGGKELCPCGTPGFWNTNWFSNIILIPNWVGKICLLLGDDLTPTELGNCTKITGRAYNTFLTGIDNVSRITGANTLDIASIGIDGAIVSSNVTQLKDAYDRVHGEVRFFNEIKSDGIRKDGSFGQHQGILYNGNYGKDYANAFLSLELSAAQTEFEADTSSRQAFEILIDAYRWMSYGNALTGVVHWDFSVIGRMLVLPILDNQATQNLKTNLSQIRLLGQRWESDVLLDTYQALEQPVKHANSGSTVGNRMFFANDYMVHRGTNYITSLKMHSARTTNNECTNSQNPLGFHTSDGLVYTRVTGDEYQDITAAWDWHLLPGITVDYGAMPLTCEQVRQRSTEDFVGGASNGRFGVAAQRYSNPTTGTLSWQKAWFFLPDDIQRVMVADVESITASPVLSVLDQRRRSGSVYIDGVLVETSRNFSMPETLFHGGVGYSFPPSKRDGEAPTLSIQLEEKTGDWATVGTSKAPPTTVEMFSAWLHHTEVGSPSEYTVYPGVASVASLKSKYSTTKLRTLNNNRAASAVEDPANNIVMIVFWEPGAVTIPRRKLHAPVTIHSDGAATLILDTRKWEVTISDPAQNLDTLKLRVKLGLGLPPAGWGWSLAKSGTAVFPSGGVAGSSVTVDLA